MLLNHSPCDDLLPYIKILLNSDRDINKYKLQQNMFHSGKLKVSKFKNRVTWLPVDLISSLFVP